MCWDNDGYWISLDSGERTARKEHRCDEGDVIAPGDRYHYGVGLFEGDFNTWKLCQRHMAASQALGAACRLYDKYSTDPPIGGLHEAYWEHLVAGEIRGNGVPDDVIEKLWVHAATIGIDRVDCNEPPRDRLP